MGFAVLLQVRVQPKAKRERIEVVDASNLKVYVTAAPEGGRANAAVVALMAKRLGVAKSSVWVVRGHRSRDKTIEIEGVTAAEAARRLVG